jgi:hypothetical protein
MSKRETLVEQLAANIARRLAAGANTQALVAAFAAVGEKYGAAIEAEVVDRLSAKLRRD